MDKLAITLVAILGYSHVIHGGYVQSGYYPTVLGQYGVHQSFLRPAIQVPTQQNQALQLRPAVSRPAIALPNTRPPVVAIHAERPQQQIVSQVVPAPQLPVVAIHAQPQPNKIVLPLPAQVVQVPNYNFGYAVKDLVTGDEKSHHESRTGDNVVGRYTVVEPDGTLRTVTYTAGIGGFNAIVERTPGYAPPNAPVKVLAVSKPIAIAPPPVIAVSRPVAYPYPAPIAVSRPIASNSHLIQPQAGTTYPAGFHFGG